ncbi:hypothetical protein CHS0354_007574 [Potamilus streckersoni]|uniref:Heat shock 70 kDa protein 12A n=1 Tax=Potamilus streckersoni TaxID=2493646 RepID=A0AAE0T4B2_9BIVA|nr:hypothetical protein CHS0354_007574 [Potamilus streckersoni]
MEIEKPLMVVAIDFGTTYSSWACSMRHEYEDNPTKIYVRQWIGGEHFSPKAPTTVLIRPDGKTLETFGYEAQNRYAELVEEGQHKTWYFFTRFKMKIFSTNELSRQTMIEDITGKLLPAITVFSRAIQFMKDDFMNQFKSKLEGRLEECDIRWVLTVPAIWNESAKQFMRQAAVTAGIRNEYLRIALEPEVASLLCIYLPVKTFAISGSQSTFQTFKKGSKYMVLDAGGGTVDITVHEVLGLGKVKELHKASGGAWGGTVVDGAFRQFLVKLVGDSIFQKFSLENTDDMLDMLRTFEVKKREIQPKKDSAIVLRIPMSLINIYQNETGKVLQESISQNEFAGKVKIINDKIKLEGTFFREFFAMAVQSITSFVRTLLQNKNLEGVKSIIMVGGFSECQILQESIMSSFPEINTIIPQDAGLVVLKGAVIYGHNHDMIVERVCRYTYGIAGARPFIKGVHKDEYMEESDVGPLCNNIFVKIVEAGQHVKLHERQTERHFNLNIEDQDEYSFPVYISSSASPTYVTDVGCTKLGSVTICGIDTSVPLKDRKVAVSMIFGGTEIEVEARDVHTNEITTVILDFLQ